MTSVPGTEMVNMLSCELCGKRSLSADIVEDFQQVEQLRCRGLWLREPR